MYEKSAQHMAIDYKVHMYYIPTYIHNEIFFQYLLQGTQPLISVDTCVQTSE
jgi:hypothetical protein